MEDSERARGARLGRRESRDNMRAIGQGKFWGIFLPMDFRAEKRVRPRGSSLSLRLRSASDLCDGGYIDSAEKGVLKDLILLGDSKLDAAFDEVERGNVGVLKGEIPLQVALILVGALAWIAPCRSTPRHVFLPLLPQKFCTSPLAKSLSGI